MSDLGPALGSKPAREPTGGPAKPSLRILHHLARSGGTLICRCLAAMDGIYLFSEIHPLTPTIDRRFARTRQHLDLLFQDRQWHGLLDRADREALRRADGIDFVATVRLLWQRAGAAGGALLLRDWSHLDFTALPFLPTCSYRSRLVEALEADFEIVNTATVRHPVEQWHSLGRIGLTAAGLEADSFLRGYRKFAELAAEIGFLRFEDFTARPDATLELLCGRLALDFDPAYEDRWWRHDKVTGDPPSRKAIVPAPARPRDPDLLERFRANPDYRAAVEMLGYPP